MSYFTSILAITSFYFLIGIIAVIFISKKRKSNDVWLKLFVYATIVFSILFGIKYDLLFYIFLLIYILGFYELWKVFYESNRGVLFFSAAVVVYIFIGGGLYHFVGLNHEEQLLLYTTVFVFDGFSQISGQLFGRKKITSISPAKTWEGFLGGTIMAIVTCTYMAKYFLAAQTGFFLSFLFITTAFFGDLLASYYKRLCGVKDYSHLIPGHGGVLDRFDSFLFSAFFAGFLTFLLRP